MRGPKFLCNKKAESGLLAVVMLVAKVGPDHARPLSWLRYPRVIVPALGWPPLISQIIVAITILIYFRRSHNLLAVSRACLPQTEPREYLPLLANTGQPTDRAQDGRVNTFWRRSAF